MLLKDGSLPAPISVITMVRETQSLERLQRQRQILHRLQSQSAQHLQEKEAEGNVKIEEKKVESSIYLESLESMVA
jgi:hypothetical protein